jgi:asparagine synthetase B (glutamine-hydrolysing)
MSLEQEMKFEIKRLENEILSLDTQIDRFNLQMSELMKLRQKKEHDVRVLKYNFYPEELPETEKQRQSTLLGMVKK